MSPEHDIDEARFHSAGRCARPRWLCLLLLLSGSAAPSHLGAQQPSGLP